jgi:hypothetical protein
MTGGGSARRRPAGWAIPAGLLALLIVLGAAWGTPRAAVPTHGAGPAGGYVALPESVGPLATAPRAELRAVHLSGQLAALPAAARVPAGTAPGAGPGHARALSPTAVPAAGGRSPPAPA